MKNRLSGLDRKSGRIIKILGNEADRLCLPAYVVGGVVRDIILRKSIVDLDFCIEGDAIKLAKVLSKRLNAVLKIYGQFQTATLRLPGGTSIDLARTRSEHYPHPGALPIIRPGPLREDLYRRDFTANALAITVSENGYGQMIDLFGGLEDISNKSIRVLHEKSFIEDPTRILRAVRFEQRFGFKIEKATMGLLKYALKTNQVSNVKPPRYFEEFKKLLGEKDPVKPLRRLIRLKAVGFLDLNLKLSMLKMTNIHRMVLNARRSKLFHGFEKWWLMYFLCLTESMGRQQLEKTLKTYPFTKAEKTTIRQTRDISDILKKLSVKRMAPSRIFALLNPLTEEAVIYVRTRSSSPTVHRRIDRFLRKDRAVILKINGGDLKRMGCRPGRDLGRVLNHVLAVKIDGKVKSRNDELHYAKCILGKIKKNDHKP